MDGRIMAVGNFAAMALKVDHFASLSRAGNLLNAIDLALGTYECQVSAKEVNACSTTGN